MTVFSSMEFRVGLLVLVVSVLVAGMTLTVNEDPSYLGGSKSHWFYIDDASGLVKKSSVKMAGISVGIIKEIELDGGMARVRMVFDDDVELYGSASVEIRSSGILGDKFVAISPGSPTDPKLRDGEEIKAVNNKVSMDKIVSQLGELSSSLNDVAGTIQGAVSGEDSNSPLAKSLKNLETLTGDLAQITSGSKGKITDIVDRVHNITATLDQFVNDDSPDGFKNAWSQAAESLANVDKTLTNIEEITNKINSGEGTLGKLVNDEQTIEELNSAISGVNDFIGSANRLQTSFDVHSEYLTEQSLAKTYAGIRIQPGLDRYFEFAVVDDPKGVTETTETSRTTTSGGSTTSSDSTQVKTFKNKTKFSALYGQRFYDFVIKGGIIESTGGLGVDYYLYRDKVRLSLEAFDFGEDAPHMRGFARYDFVRGLYLIGGADDFASTEGTFSTFIGAGIDLTNDDIKSLATKVPF